LACIFTDSQISILFPPLRRHFPSIARNAHTTEFHHYHLFLHRSPRHPCTTLLPSTHIHEVRHLILRHQHHPELLRPMSLHTTLFLLQHPLFLRCSHIAIRVLLLQLTSLSLALTLPVQLSHDLRASLTYFQSVRAGAGSRVPCGLRNTSKLGKTGSLRSLPAQPPKRIACVLPLFWELCNLVFYRVSWVHCYRLMYCLLVTYDDPSMVSKYHGMLPSHWSLGMMVVPSVLGPHMCINYSMYIH